MGSVQTNRAADSNSICLIARPLPLVSPELRNQIPIPCPVHHCPVELTASTTALLRRRILAHDLLDPPFVLRPVSLEHVVSLRLSRGLGVGVVEQVLDAEEDLLDGDGRLPRLLLVQDRQADGAGWVDVRVEERGCEFACRRAACQFV